MINLLHLSDLHFGYDRDETARDQRREALDGLLKVLGRLEPEWTPHIVVISGDLAWQGRASGYTELGDWLTTKLFPATGLSAADCVICPGNHDLDRKATRALVKRTHDPQEADELLRPEYLADGFARPFSLFVKFAAEFGIPAPQLHDAPNYLAGMRESHGIRFVCLNSAWFCRNSQTDRGELWLGLPQLQAMPPLSNQGDYDKAPITVALVHHPPDWLANQEINAYDRPNTYGYLAERVHVILSGHTHGTIEEPTRYYGRASLFLGGASYDNQTYRNNFSVFRLDPAERTIRRRPWEFDPRKTKWEEKTEGKYGLRGEKLARGALSPERYLAWLRGKTQFIDLHQLKVGPGETPPPAIDALYIHLKTALRPLAAEDPAPRATPERAQPMPLEEALRSRRLVIEGKPGGGKTTFVRWIAWMLCRPTGPPSDFPLQGLPLLVRISELDQYIAKTLDARAPGDPAHDADARWIAHFLASQGWGLDEAFFREKLEAENTVLLLDGLDEAASQTRREKIVQMFQTAAAQCGCHIVVTTRPGAHEGRTTLAGFEIATIDDLDGPGIDGFLMQWCRWLKGGDEPAAQAYYAELHPAVAVPSIRLLARNPLMLTALAVLHLRRHRLPEQRAQLYEQIMDWLAEQAVERSGQQWKKEDLLARFGKLALAMQEWKGGQKLQIGVDTAAGLLTAKGESIDPVRCFLEEAQRVSGIVTLRGGEIAFWHRSFQEYLAARTLAGLLDSRLWRRSPKFLYSPEGREVLPLVAGYMAASARERLDALIERLTSHAVSQKTLERRAHAAGVLGNMLADLAPTSYALSKASAQAYGALSHAVMAIFEKGKARNIGLKTRVAAAEALDQARQSRLRMPGDANYWVDFRGRKFTMRGDPEAYRSLPKRAVSLGTFSIGKFPVTVWEYGRYLDDTLASAPEDWDAQAIHPSRPATSVTWYDAKRYCEWASRRWDIRCGLPSDEQWEFAARGAEGRIYPWGGVDPEPDEHRANFNRMVREPTPVGMFPEGSTPEGVADMAGNVWEWTRSDFEDGHKSVRGASFSLAAADLRAACRYWYVPGYTNYYIGFRCVRE
jgi:formylglycine-generating enzyme required for sulfatase activity